MCIKVTVKITTV